ncbi:WD40-repeat-containing domain protein [Naematelia encephala]|uniref:WD40-repeat-containing domain protein n=1 Tax=Naematelia encephala TaxID=71784 RepID=A0A1Y2B644_9TREE|nr:WD40-repeat-containing domain protein [Naematelia encephala]
MSAFPKVYTVNGPSSTSSSSLPSWLTIKARPSANRKRTKTQRQLGQLELVQDFSFPQAAIRIKTTPDGRHAIGTGTYKPMMKVWDLEELTTKFERVTDAENVDFQILSDDWTKTLHLQRDRSLQLHTQMGLHHTIRLPTYGRCLGYHSPSADALVGCTGTQVFRFNLEEGRYMTPLDVAHGFEDDVEGVNVVDVNPQHGLWSFGMDGGGFVEFWDPRSRTALTRLHLPSDTLLPVQPIESTVQHRLGVTALTSHPTDGLSLAVGTSTGHTLLYDLRSPTPFAVKDQGYGEPMRAVNWLRGGGAQEDNGRVISADSKVIKVWGKDDPSTNHLSLHPPSSLQDLHPVPNSGLLFVACDAAPLSSYYIPEIGPAPRWASFLDSVTEELADDAGQGKGAYTDFKFIDKAELESLGLSHLVGTPALKPYMHGYFLSLKLYTTARLIANPTSYEDYRARLVSDKLAAKAESRIRARRDQPKVNKALAERLRRADEAEQRKKRRMGAEAEAEGPAGVLDDERFKEVFENPEFEVDEESREFALLNPATAANNAVKRTAVQDEEDESEGSSSGLGESESENEEEQHQQGGDSEGSEEESDDSGDGDLRQYDPRNVKPGTEHPYLPASGPSRPRLVYADNRPQRGDTFGQRLAQRSSTNGNGKGKSASSTNGMDGVLAVRRGADGGMEMSFVPQKGGANGNDGVQREKRDKTERFGAGMEKGGREDEGDDDGDGRGGRTKRRFVGRSASKNAFRRR